MKKGAAGAAPGGLFDLLKDSTDVYYAGCPEALVHTDCTTYRRVLIPVNRVSLHFAFVPSFER